MHRPGVPVIRPITSAANAAEPSWAVSTYGSPPARMASSSGSTLPLGTPNPWRTPAARRVATISSALFMTSGRVEQSGCVAQDSLDLAPRHLEGAGGPGGHSAARSRGLSLQVVGEGLFEDLIQALAFPGRDCACLSQQAGIEDGADLGPHMMNLE